MTAAQCEDKSVERPGGKGYVLCNEAYIEMNARHEVSKCMLAAPLTYDVYGGTDVCPKNGVIKFDERGRVVGCAMVKQKNVVKPHY